MKKNILFSLALVFFISACFGEKKTPVKRGANTQKSTAPALATTPHRNFSKNGSLDTNKYSAVQSGYVQRGGK